MSLINKASLIITPNAYTEGKLYSVVPNTVLGDMTVVRATTATRVNELGLIEQVPYNLLTYSEQFDNASWAKNGSITVTANATTSPNGSLTADLVSNVDITDFISQICQSNTIGVEYIYSVYVKNNNASKSAILVRNSISSVGGTINWSGSTLSSLTGVTNGTMTYEYIRDGWYRIIATFTSVESVIRPRFTPDILAGNSSVYLWGGQLVQGSEAKTYLQTTDRLNVPRLDYTNSSCPSILVEPQRTNVILNSENLGNTSATVTVTRDYYTSPNGTLTGDSYLINPINSLHKLFYEPILGGFTTNSIITMSTFVKKDGAYNNVIFGADNGAMLATFNINDGTVVSKESSVISATITPFTNGYYRITNTFTFTNPVGNGYLYEQMFFNNRTSYLGDGTSKFGVWGTQVEVGSSATSYIPTTIASVTRNADVISKTGISSLIGQTEGTVFVEFNNQLINSTLVCLNKNSTNSLFLTTSGGTSITVRAYINSVIVFATISGYTTFNQKIKACFKYGSFGLKLFINGELKATNNTSIVFTASLSSLNLNDDVVLNANSTIKNNGVLIFPTALSDSQCISLTTL